jgi:hypothetical protein
VDSLDDDDKTPTESPSAMHRLGLATCFVCDGARIVDGKKCEKCGGGGRVTLTEFNAHLGLKP